MYDQFILKTNEEALIPHGAFLLEGPEYRDVNIYHKVVSLFYFTNDSDGLWLSGREKVIDGEKESDLAWVICQAMTIETINVEGFLFYIVFFTANNIL